MLLEQYMFCNFYVSVIIEKKVLLYTVNELIN